MYGPEAGGRRIDLGKVHPVSRPIFCDGASVARATWGSTDLGGTIGLLHAGAKLRVAFWPPADGGVARGPGTVILVTGRAEFIECYGETIADLRRMGYAVVAFDLRGQGGSSRQTRAGGHVGAFRDYGADIAAVVRFAGEVGLPRPYTVLAHSMGGLAALRVQPLIARDVERMVLLAPMLQVAELPMPAGLLRGVSWIACLIGLGRRQARKQAPAVASGKFAVNRVTSDAERYERIAALVEANRDLCIGPPTFGWLRAALSAMRKTRGEIGRPLAIPTLFVASAADRVVSTPAIDRFARAAPGGGMVLVRGARHQLLMERDELRDLFFAAFKAFVADARHRNAAKTATRVRTGKRQKFVLGSEGDPDLVYEAWKIPGVAEPTPDAERGVVALDRTAVTEAQAGRTAEHAPAAESKDAEPAALPQAGPAQPASPPPIKPASADSLSARRDGDETRDTAAPAVPPLAARPQSPPPLAANRDAPSPAPPPLRTDKPAHTPGPPPLDATKAARPAGPPPLETAKARGPSPKANGATAPTSAGTAGSHGGNGRDGAAPQMTASATAPAAPKAPRRGPEAAGQPPAPPQSAPTPQQEAPERTATTEADGQGQQATPRPEPASPPPAEPGVSGPAAEPAPQAGEPAPAARFNDITPGWLGAEEDDRDVVLSLGNAAFTPHQGEPPAPQQPPQATEPRPETTGEAKADDGVEATLRKRLDERIARRQEGNGAAPGRGAARAKLRQRLRREGREAQGERPADPPAAPPPAAEPAPDEDTGPDWTVGIDENAATDAPSPEETLGDVVPQKSTLPPTRRDSLGARRPRRR